MVEQPYERSTGKAVEDPSSRVWGVASCIQPLKGEKVGSKMEPKFEPGIYLGLQEGSALKWVGTPDGVVRSWSFEEADQRQRDGTSRL